MSVARIDLPRSLEKRHWSGQRIWWGRSPLRNSTQQLEPLKKLSSALFNLDLHQWLGSFTGGLGGVGLFWSSVSIKPNQNSLEVLEVRGPVLKFLYIRHLFQTKHSLLLLLLVKIPYLILRLKGITRALFHQQKTLFCTHAQNILIFNITTFVTK